MPSRVEGAGPECWFEVGEVAARVARSPVIGGPVDGLLGGLDDARCKGDRG